VQLNKDGELKSYRLFGLSSLLLLLLATTTFAKSFEDFKKTQNSSFETYRDANDKEFSNYLKSEWQEYSAKKSKPLYEKPKPKSITPTTPKQIISVGPLVQVILPKEIPEVKEDIKPSKIIIVKEIVPKDINFEFFGDVVGFDIDNKAKVAHFYPQNQEGILNFFNTVAASDYEYTLEAIKKLSLELELNDWGVYQLVMKFSEASYENADDRKLYAWFMFNKLGYDVKVGLGGKHIVMMHYSEKVIYATPNYHFDKKKFYVISLYAQGTLGKRLYSYKQSYPNATKPLDLQLTSLPKFSKNEKKKTLTFKQFGEEYSTSYHYNQNLIDFMATYPQADYETYFNSPLSKETYEELARGLKKHLDGKKASVAINFVLNFVQKAFVYQVDEKQFGREKVMFANETLYYDKSDCEDRAILFSYLVKELFHINVIGVKYKDHMATALYIPMKGDSVRSGNKKFIIADPTYINANIGQSMPRYKSKIPKSFIFVRN